MSKYWVILCPKCGTPRQINTNQKTAGCFKCGNTITVDPKKTLILLKTDSSTTARLKVQQHKMLNGSLSNIKTIFQT